jgi:hypothetical protein
MEHIKSRLEEDNTCKEKMTNKHKVRINGYTRNRKEYAQTLYIEHEKVERVRKNQYEKR